MTKARFFWLDRMGRYREVIEYWLSDVKANRWHCTNEELDALGKKPMRVCDLTQMMTPTLNCESMLIIA
jgi:hypothetical protein